MSVDTTVRRMVVPKVLAEHERGPGFCACGAVLGDSLDWLWHIANQTATATAHFLEPHIRATIAAEVEADQERIFQTEDGFESDYDEHAFDVLGVTAKRIRGLA